jgi:hypothetical protein
MRLYHGTTATEGGKGTEAIRRIKPSKEGALGSGIYTTPNTAHASSYTGIPNDEALAMMSQGNDYTKKMADQFMADRASGRLREGQAGGNMLPVHVQMRNPLIIGKSGRNIDPAADALMSLGMDEASAIKLVERAFEEKGNIGKQIQSRAQAQGYDGIMQYRGDDLSEVVSYNPNAVKSAIGNRGTYDINEPDLGKAEGGLLHMADAGRVVKGGAKFLKKLLSDAPQQEALRVYHGSPHRMAPTPENPLGKFDSSKMGTGEGGASYGAGHYLAQAKPVAKTYQPRSPLYEEKLLREYKKAEAKQDYAKMEVLEDAMMHSSPKEIGAKFTNIDDGYTPEHIKAASEFAQWSEKNKPEVGGLYHVDLLKEHIDNMIDYDKPINQQSDQIKALLKKAGINSESSANAGQMIYGQESHLAKHGIPGVKYYDEKSRHLTNWEVGKSGSGTWMLKNNELSPNQWKEFPTEEEAKAAYNAMPDTGTRNFVVFPGNEDIAKIVDREKKGGAIHKAEGGGAFKKLQFMDKGGLTTSGGSFSPEELGVNASDIGMSDKRWNTIKRNAVDLYGEGKEQLEKEYRQLGRKGGKKDFAIRVGSQFLGGVPDLINLGLEGIDLAQSYIPAISKPESVLDTAGTGDRIPKFKLASEKPYLGSQHFIDRFKEAELLGNNEFPLTELVAGFAAPAAAVGALKKSKQAYKGAKSLMDTPKKRRGGLTAMAR